MKHIVCALGLLIFILTIQSPEAQAACSSPSGNAGKIAYNQTAKTFQYCNGTDWIAMNQPGSGSGGCANPTLDEGYMVYNGDHRVMQGCAGNVFQAMGPVDGNQTGEWLQISAGQSHSCAVKKDNSAWCWGSNGSGRLGDGTIANSQTPVEVSGGYSWKYISAGGEHSCGIQIDDSLWCWGNDTNLQLGDGATTGPQTAPVTVSGGGTWKSVSAGGDMTCGIKTDNTGWCWGNDSNGKLGIGATGASNAPVEIDGASSWKVIRASLSGFSTATCGIKSDDTAWCWGSDFSGTVGNGAIAGNQESPSPVSGGATWKDIDVGALHACGIQSDNTGWCWGSDSYGEIGNGATTGLQIAPVSINGGHTWKSLRGGASITCGIKSDDTTWCWGYGYSGGIGAGGSTTTADVPTAVSGGHSWAMIDTGAEYNCGISADGALYCWGLGTNGSLGNGDAPERYIPNPQAINNSLTWLKISSGGPGFGGGAHSCGIKTDNSLWCWGMGNSGQLGDNTAAISRATPNQITGGGSWKDISTGGQHSCGIMADDTMRCWGDGMNGRLGNAGTAPSATPVTLSGGGTWKSVGLGRDHTCGIKSDDTAWCWGHGSWGARGDGSTTTTRTTPVIVSGGYTWKMVSGGAGFTCGIQTNDSLWCWGVGPNGQRGDGTTTTSQTTAIAVSGGGTWKKVSAGVGHACAIKSDDTLWCWGLNTDAQLGDGTTTQSLVPVAVSGGGTWKNVYAADSHTCAMKSDDTLWCWGRGSTGLLGNVSLASPVSTPSAVTGGHKWKSADAGANTSCGIIFDDTAWCWGDSRYGQLGAGIQDGITTPELTWCGQPAGKAGAIRYNSSSDRLQYCDSVNWVAFGGFGMGAAVPPPDPCAGSPAAGTVCGDGTVYAGLSPDGNVKMFVTRCDAGQSWDGSTCTGSRTNHFWNDGVNNYVATGATSLITGASNTTTITGTDANSVAGGMQQHQAAQYCADLNINGHSDWYLPAQNELAVMYANNATIGNFLTSALGHYWTSTELSANSSTYFDFQMGWDSGSLKQSVNPQRCARK